MELREWFEKGLTKEQYLNHMQVNKEGMLTIYEGFSLSEEEKEALQEVKQKNLHAIVLTEDWCGDAMINNPVLLKIAEEIGMEVRFVLRDSNLELMDQYLTNGTARAIPIFVFIDEAGAEQAVWGPRAPRLQDYVMERRTSLPAKEDPSFEQAQKELYKSIGETYQSDPSLWHSVAESIIAKLK
ncbi:thioredoxin family protein [Cytobacillus sp. FSL W7-1323]|uniref:Thioredoxin family protein n=1 Tax=Cytobacillus kochii TaxID=859143 RepID=A0A248TG58_9BACI|nr:MULTISPECIES: thioredoxin family protein [Cytobacillus]ASV67102.1 thioredoxin family protein [Cytobacillus kochii]MEA1854704.1 thioredoxin family protein [Cytobacillus sp. OWB-43]MED1606059.1 thioredoxin family protein [Cytobacillus kochii]